MECNQLLLAMVVYKITVIDIRELIRINICDSGVEMICISIFDTIWQVNMQLSVVCQNSTVCAILIHLLICTIFITQYNYLCCFCTQAITSV